MCQPEKDVPRGRAINLIRDVVNVLRYAVRDVVLVTRNMVSAAFVLILVKFGLYQIFELLYRGVELKPLLVDGLGDSVLGNAGRLEPASERCDSRG